MMISDKNIRLLQVISYVAGMFTLFVAVTMIFGYIQLQAVKPLENPALVNLKEQYDKNPNSEDLKEQVRTLDLMARRAYFTTRWQIETGTYLLLAGGIVFVFCQQLTSRSRKIRPDIPGEDPDMAKSKRISRLYLGVSSIIVITAALLISFSMRKSLPDPLPVPEEVISAGISRTVEITGQQTASVESVTEPGITVTGSEQQATEGIETISGEKAEATTTRGDNSRQAYNGDGINYPFLRGPGSRGVIEDTGYPREWDGHSGSNIVWKTEVPKSGFSSPVIWGDKLFITGADNEGAEVYCYNKQTGALTWRAPATNIPGEPAEPPETSEDTGLAAPTAATNGTVVCAIFATGNLICLDMEGNRRWAKNIGIPENHYGHSSSLVIYENILLVQFDHFRSKSIIAFDINSGNKLWETVRRVALSWASPVLAVFDGVPQVILTSEPAVISYDVKTGKELWSVNCMGGEVGPSVGVNSRYVFAANEYAKLVAIKPGPDAKVIWEDNEYLPEVSSPVANDELVFIATTFGAVAAYDANNGELVWDHDFAYGFYSSPMLVGDNVYLTDQSGVTQIFKARRSFSLVAESPLGEKAVCTPAFSENRIYIRGEESLYCIGIDGAR
ncbi:MAG TPA: PQQ-binding-like beta-propeller repeat protein [Bacteroidales bacterium]|nr:PQQ-binding-like beta-propeller repeat protein [Bacteroidales bacterium]